MGPKQNTRGRPDSCAPFPLAHGIEAALRSPNSPARYSDVLSPGVFERPNVTELSQDYSPLGNVRRLASLVSTTTNRTCTRPWVSRGEEASAVGPTHSCPPRPTRANDQPTNTSPT